MIGLFIQYVGLVMAVLREAFEIREFIARRVSPRRRDKELRPARPFAATPSAAVPEARDLDVRPGIPYVLPDESLGADAAPARETGGAR